eukprot:scaffold8105_cov255-Prasinococcus_capsulatus_cf.AAC.1
MCTSPWLRHEDSLVPVGGGRLTFGGTKPSLPLASRAGTTRTRRDSVSLPDRLAAEAVEREAGAV